MSVADLDNLLETLCCGRSEAPFDFAGLTTIEALPVVARYLSRPMQIDAIERVEGVYKRYLKAAFRPGLSGAEARFVAAISRQVGFTYKFKPYGVKCANALGYSIFFLWPGMGFSFQRHRTRKTELFHILKRLDRGQVFLSTSREWDAVYEKNAFNRWLAGVGDTRYESYSRKPQPGDVYLVTELDTIHAVFGCVLEEYATVSTDMVDRLHDQNASSRDDVATVEISKLSAWLADLPCPVPDHCWKRVTESPVDLAKDMAGGVTKVVLANTGEFLAERFDVEAGGTMHLPADSVRARSLFCLGGDCRIVLCDASEIGITVAPLMLKAGEQILVGPGMDIMAAAATRTSLSSHTIRPELALD